MDIQLVM